MKKSQLLAVSTLLPVLAFGWASPSQAAAVTSPSVTSTGLVNGSTNPNPIVVKATVTTGGVSDGIAIDLPAGWSFANPNSAPFSCVGFTNATATGMSPTFCRSSNTAATITPGTVELYFRNLNNYLSAGTEVTVTIAAGAINVGSPGDFIILFTYGPTVNDTSASIPSVAAPATTSVPTSGTAEILASLPKSDKVAKLNFGRGNNGLSKSVKKKLKNLAEVADTNGFGIRITAEAGAQTGVDRDIVKALARKRAKEIRAYLVKQGFDMDDIEIKAKVVSEGTKPNTDVKLVVLD